MLLVWEAGRPLADREMIAHLYQVSVRTVRRHCTPVRTQPRRGRADGRHGGGGAALYDALAAGDVLTDVAPRPGGAITALRRAAASVSKGSR